MKKWVIIAFVIHTIALWYPSCLSNNPTIQLLVKQICSERCSKREHKQQALLQKLRKTKNLTPDLYDPVLDALEAGNTFELLRKQENKNTINQSLQKLGTITGFYTALLHVMQHVDNQQQASGYLYEIETALHILQQPQDNEQLISMEQIKKDSTGHTREFDLITTHRWIECKTGSPCNFSKQQLLDQHAIVDAYNNSTPEHQSVSHCLVSKKSVSEDMHEWLTQQEIVCYEFSAQQCKKHKNTISVS